MIPYQGLLTPLYLLFAKIGLANSHVGLAIVHTIDMPDEKLMEVEELLQDPHVVVAGAHNPIVRRRGRRVQGTGGGVILVVPP